jgi:AcrR family transcriptional regulator
MSRESDKTRQKIIQAADSLFYAESLRNVSVDEIAAVAGVTKKTLYYHFRSKDELIAAYLQARNQPTIDRFKDWAGSDGTVAERLVRLFRRLSTMARSRNWLGCGFMRVSAELANMPGHPALAVARAHKLAVEEWLRNDLAAEGWAHPDAIARGLIVLIDGTVAQMLKHRDPLYAEAATRMVENVLGFEARQNAERLGIEAEVPASPGSSITHLPLPRGDEVAQRNCRK